ncbi:hypothetical protein ACLM5J_07035 [Nocardioides sp. Bht2]
MFRSQAFPYLGRADDRACRDQRNPAIEPAEINERGLDKLDQRNPAIEPVEINERGLDKLDQRSPVIRER